MLNQLTISMAKWYLFNMPPSERGPWTWEVYDLAMEIVYGKNRR